MSLSAIPLPIRLVAGLLVGMLVFSLARSGEIFLILAALLWAVVLIGLIHETGAVPALSRIGFVSTGLNRLTNRSARAPRASEQTEAPAGGARLGEAERRELLEEGLSELRTVVGQEAALDTIETRIFEPARRSTEDAPNFGSRAPALLVLIAGPVGVGARTIARAIGKVLAGYGALRTGKLVDLRPRDVRSGVDHVEAVTRKAEEAVGGMLLIEDADWFLNPDPYGGAKGPGLEAGSALLDVAEANPRAFVIVATLSEATLERLRNDPEHAKWIGRLGLRIVRLDPLDDDQLLGFLRREAEGMGYALSPDAERSARLLLREYREVMGDGFDNAEACRRLAEQLATAVSEMALEGEAPSGGARAGAIERRHVQRVQETWE
jgi:hypothetical protein